MADTASHWRARLDRWLAGIETLLLGLILFSMLALACTQILLRNVFDSGIGWADPMIRAEVLWLGLVGAVAAARRNKHIRVDVLTRFLGPRLRALAAVVSDAFTGAVSGLIAWHGGRLVMMEREFQTIAFAEVPAWTLQLIIPTGFGIIAVIYGVLVVTESVRAIRGRAD